MEDDVLRAVAVMRNAPQHQDSPPSQPQFIGFCRAARKLRESRMAISRRHKTQKASKASGYEAMQRMRDIITGAAEKFVMPENELRRYPDAWEGTRS